MSVQIVTLTVDSTDPQRSAQFWGQVLGWQVADDFHGGVAVVPADDKLALPIMFLASDAATTGPNQMHFHLTSTSPEDQDATIAAVLEHGGSHLDVGQLPEEGHVVLADPDGNEFCVIEPGNGFLADTAFLGELSCDGSRTVGQFWSEALGWPLVWDQDEETAIQSPSGGVKISWGGPPVREMTGKNRMHFDLAPVEGSDQQAEVDRLVSLGATPLDIGQGDVPWVVMADPDGNEFCVLPPI